MRKNCKKSMILLLLTTTFSSFGKSEENQGTYVKDDSLGRIAIEDSAVQKVSYSKQYIYIASDSLKTSTIDSLDNIAMIDSISQTINYAEQNVYVAKNTNVLGETHMDTLLHKITYYEPLKASHHWFVTGNVGGLLYVGESDRRGPFINRLSPSLELGGGKWLSPHVGLRLMYSGLQARGHIAKKYVNNTAQTDELVNDNWYKQKWNLNYYHLDLMVDLFGRAWEESYKLRNYSLQPYASFGVLSSPEVNKPAFAMGVGLNNVFRLNQYFNLNVDLKAVLADDRFDSELNPNEGLKYEGIAYLTVGLTYKFKTTKKKALRNIHVNNQYINYYNVGNKETEPTCIAPETVPTNAATNSVAPTNTVSPADTAQIIEEKEFLFAPAAIFFGINSSELSMQDKVNLMNIARSMKEAPEAKVFTVVGYSDNKPGSVEANIRTSKRRAEAVYNALVNEFGVDKAKLKMDYKGGVESMFFNDYRLNRVVLIE